ncbi:MAG: hypothetical protein NVSMB62_02890 [Acidobacteriaceae bacterium]
MVNIQNVLERVRETLDGFLKESMQGTEDFVVLSNLVNSDGTRSSNTTNKIVVSLANIEQISVAAGIRGPQVSPSVTTDLYVSIFAKFEDGWYAVGLDLIARVMGYLQSHPILGRSDNPGLDAGIERLSFEFVNLDAAQWSDYLRMAGVNYLPATMYKVRIQPVRS